MIRAKADARELSLRHSTTPVRFCDIRSRRWQLLHEDRFCEIEARIFTCPHPGHRLNQR